MSIELVKHALDNGPECSNDRFVYLAIGERVNQASVIGEAWPSITDIVARTRLSRSTVLRSIKNLESAGWMEVKKGSGRKNSSHYFLKKVPHRHYLDPEKVSDRHHSEDEKRCLVDQERCHADAEMVSHRRRNGVTQTPEPEGTINEPEGEPLRKIPQRNADIAAHVVSVCQLPEEAFDLTVEAIQDIAVQGGCSGDLAFAAEVLKACIAEAKSREEVVDCSWLGSYRWEECDAWWNKKHEVTHVQQAQS